MNRNPIGLIWIVGLVLAVLLTVLGPGAIPAMLARSVDALSLDLARLGTGARELIRGIAIAAWVVFIALCVLARRQGLPSMGQAVVVTLLFVLLVGGPGSWDRPAYGAHWLLALILNVAAALGMTARLRRRL